MLFHEMLKIIAYDEVPEELMYVLGFRLCFKCDSWFNNSTYRGLCSACYKKTMG